MKKETSAGNKRLKICVACSVGGHFKQMLKLAPSWKDFDYFYLLFHKPVLKSFLEKEKVYIVCNPERNPFRFIVNIFQSLAVFLKARPDVIISNGAGVAVAICYIAKLFRRKVVYVEDWCVIKRPSISGRIIYPISDLFVIQRHQLKEFYPKAVFGGELF